MRARESSTVLMSSVISEMITDAASDNCNDLIFDDSSGDGNDCISDRDDEISDFNSRKGSSANAEGDEDMFCAVKDAVVGLRDEYLLNGGDRVSVEQTKKAAPLKKKKRPFTNKKAKPKKG